MVGRFLSGSSVQLVGRVLHGGVVDWTNWAQTKVVGDKGWKSATKVSRVIKRMVNGKHGHIELSFFYTSKHIQGSYVIVIPIHVFSIQTWKKQTWGSNSAICFGFQWLKIIFKLFVLISCLFWYLSTPNWGTFKQLFQETMEHKILLPELCPLLLGYLQCLCQCPNTVLVQPVPLYQYLWQQIQLIQIYLSNSIMIPIYLINTIS